MLLQDLIQELIHLSKIWSDAKRDKKFCPNEQSNDMKQCFFQIPMRQLLQNQILLSVKEIQRNAKRRNTSLGRLLSFENGSDHHRTLMYIIKGPKKRNEDEKQNTSSVKPKPRRPQSAFPSRRTLQEQSTEIDVVEQAECGVLCCLLIYDFKYNLFLICCRFSIARRATDSAPSY